MNKPKIAIRKYRMSDLERLCELFLNDNVVDNLAMPKKAKDITRKQEADWIRKKIRNYRLKEPEELAFAITMNGDYVGSIGAHKIDYKNEKLEVGYWIGEPYWGQGITSEALRQFVKYLFKRFKFKRISGIAYAHNIGSQRVLEKAGFKYEGTMRKASKKHGKFYDDKLYAIVR